MPNIVNEQTTDAVTQTNVRVLGDSAPFAMGLVYQFAAHSSGLAMENATVATNFLNTVTNASAASMTALKVAEANALSSLTTSISEAYNSQTAAISQALNAQTQSTAAGLNAITTAGSSGMAAQTAQDIAGLTADSVAATAVAMYEIVKQMAG
ncbi:RebB family R body protein [Oceanibacterium hippocampi]|uniref:Killing trait n=1 Tax=Oceanibacterium hippocampi TaxID=745714 RepID=A0A1Y5TD75_9PROT|nr:RebB family R body protein [Oceanibacterium hippocampi]SLN57753.1 Killing trait [Oceanibacterium hippocampi]